jgi:HTH-type transcriptional regulator, competence development regulator
MLDTFSILHNIICMGKRTLGEFLKGHREVNGFTLRAVEQETGISNAYLSQLESDKIRQPSPVNLHKLCELYRVSYATAMELTGYPVPGGELLPSSRIGVISKDEEDALLEYLQFYRSRGKKGKK